MNADGHLDASGRAPLRVGLCGFFLECNRWSPVTTASMFADSFDLAGDALQAELLREANGPERDPSSIG